MKWELYHHTIWAIWDLITSRESYELTNTIRWDSSILDGSLVI